MDPPDLLCFPGFHGFWTLHFLNFPRGPTQKGESGNRVPFRLYFAMEMECLLEGISEFLSVYLGKRNVS